jgi:predicted nucleotidyltransferase
MTQGDLIKERQRFSESMLQNIRDEISKIEVLTAFEDKLCIYVTGSFARGEASKYSDIDIFFISKGPIKNLDFILLKAELIKITRTLELPDFSGDGEFLTNHDLSDIIKKLGSPEDDYKNYFTARMLLLLESKPLFNDKLYNEAILDIIKVYFNDYAKHEVNFKPIFLANDIIRFWKTMCLNYEEKRKRNESDKTSKPKYRLKNLKLKFSRITTCYSLLCCLKEDNQTPDDLHNLILKTPLERLSYIKDNQASSIKIVKKMIALYEWFLRSTEDETSNLHDWIKVSKNKNLANKNAGDFHDNFYDLLQLTSNKLLKYYTL